MIKIALCDDDSQFVSKLTGLIQSLLQNGTESPVITTYINPVVLTASVSRQEKDDKGPFLSLQPQAALAMTPDSARRLASALLQALQQYDERFGAHQGQGAQN